MSRLSVLITFLISANTHNFLGAFEHTKVLPKGVRNFTIKNVQTSIDSKRNKTGSLEALGQPLEKDLTFERIIKGENGLKKTQLEALLLSEGFNESESLGKISADMKGNVSVFAPVFSIGLSERFTLALAVPYYQGNMAVKLGFQMNRPVVDKFINSMTEKNEIKSAREVTDKLNNAVGELNKKLNDNNYRAMEDWQGNGLGDMTLAGKYKAYSGSIFNIASTNGVILPTGKTSNPDILNDIPFGKGTTDYFTSLILDEYILPNTFLNQYIKYTTHLSNNKEMRLITEEESIEVDKAKTKFKMGDQWEFGSSVQFEPKIGLVAGLGYVHSKKFGDRYSINGHDDFVRKVQSNTDSKNNQIEAKLGYSGVNAYKKGQIPAPFLASIEYKKHLSGKNQLSNDLVTVDFALFF